MGYDIDMTSGYYLAERKFENAELRMLIDSVLFSKTIGTKQAKELIEKLKSMGNRYFQAKVSHVSNLPGLQHTDNKQLMYVLDKINDAISQKRKISFIYNEYGTDFKLHPKREERYVVNPYQMVANNGFYYLIGNYDKYNDISHYRMDRMTCVEILPDKVKPQDQIEGFENGLNLPKHMAEHIYMFSGDSVSIKMLAAESLINELVDWFGKDFRIYEKYPDNQVMVSLKCNEHAFFYWALQYGPYVEVLEPVSLRNRIADVISEMNEKYHTRRMFMNNIKFQEMNKKKRNLYERMWGSTSFDYPVEKSIYKGEPSKNSYTFAGAYINDKDASEEIQEEYCRDRLAEIFGIADTELFKDKFHMSIGGSGRELKRIATVHSSSLCALLFFYGVSKSNPYELNIAGTDYVFTESYFEYQNTVIEGRNPSNMDVVLIGEEKKTGLKTVFFIESKFSEYYERPGKKLNIATEYLKDKYSKSIYKSGCLEKMGINLIEKAGESEFSIESEDSCYLEGIKQMISHFIGVVKLCDNPASKSDAIAKAISEGAKVILGEILFTDKIGKLPVNKSEECFGSYRTRYQVLSEELNTQLGKIGLNGKVEVLPDILSYDIFKDANCIKEDRIKKFYFELGR